MSKKFQLSVMDYALINDAMEIVQMLMHEKVNFAHARNYRWPMEFKPQEWATLNKAIDNIKYRLANAASVGENDKVSRDVLKNMYGANHTGIGVYNYDNCIVRVPSGWNVSANSDFYSAANGFKNALESNGDFIGHDLAALVFMVIDSAHYNGALQPVYMPQYMGMAQMAGRPASALVMSVVLRDKYNGVIRPAMKNWIGIKKVVNTKNDNNVTAPVVGLDHVMGYVNKPDIRNSVLGLLAKLKERNK